MKILKQKWHWLPGFLWMWGNLFLSLVSAQEVPLTPQARQMYEQYHQSVMQVRVISKGSGEKSTLGSGFFFTPDGLLATNYHVVADAVNFPTLFSAECILYDGRRGALEILNIDPVHDLAILEADVEFKQFLPLGRFDLRKGDKIFSFGNPYDLGMIIIEGLFNGLLEQARYPKILFSGSLNPGMSGGPAVSADGQVIGVNVATAGNDISFFVPVEYLHVLHNEIKNNNNKSVGYNWKAIIRKRLVLDQQDFLEKMMTHETWNKRRIGIAEMPGEISKEFKCWGRTGDNKRYWLVDTYLTCSTEDAVFISDTMRTGMIHLDYAWYESRGNNPVRFYNLYESYAADRSFKYNFGDERDVGNHDCTWDFLDVQGRLCRIEFCARHYKMYEGLYDISAQVLTADMMSKGLVANVTMLGFTEIQAKTFLRRFLKEIQWLD